MKLYEIDAALQSLLDSAVDPETGEINEEVYAQIEDLAEERDHKVEAIALAYKNAKAEAEAYKAEKMSFARKQTVAENNAERLKNFLAYALAGEKFKTEKVSVSYRKSEAVEVENVLELPAEFQKVTYEANKTAIKDELKAGGQIIGCTLVEKQNVMVK